MRACNQLGQFLSNRETNLRYLALESMCLLATSEFSHEAVKKHQDTVIHALKTERDVSVRQRAVDLLYAMCDRTNSEDIVLEMLTYLETADYSIREEMVRRSHDDSANDNSANDKMAARFSHTDDSATFLFEKKGQNFFPTPHGFHIKTFPTPYGCQKGLTLPLTGFSYPWRELIFSLKKLFLTPNLLQIGKNGLNWPSFFYVT